MQSHSEVLGGQEFIMNLGGYNSAFCFFFGVRLKEYKLGGGQHREAESVYMHYLNS